MEKFLANFTLENFDKVYMGKFFHKFYMGIVFDKFYKKKILTNFTFESDKNFARANFYTKILYIQENFTQNNF